MTDYKLVPVEPTLDMLCEGMDVYGSEDCAEADVLGIYKAMLAAAPAVQGEPVGWESIDGLPHDPDEDELFWFARSDGYVDGPRRIQPCGYDYDEFEFFRPVEPPALYAAPQPAEQQPAPDVADYEQVLDDHRRLTRELDVLLNGEEGAAQQASLADLVAQLRTVVRNTGKPVLAAPDVAGLVEALGRALYFIRGDGYFEHREALERCECYACVTGEIIDSLAAHRKQQEGEA